MDYDVRVNNRKRMRLDCKRMTCVVCGLAFLCAGMVARQIYCYHSLRGKLGEAENRVELLRQKKQKLMEEKAALGKLDYVEKVARDNYNMIKKNEVPVFIVEEKDK